MVVLFLCKEEKAKCKKKRKKSKEFADPWPQSVGVGYLEMVESLGSYYLCALNSFLEHIGQVSIWGLGYECYNGGTMCLQTLCKVCLSCN